MAADEPGKGPLARGLRGFIDGLLETAQTRLELFVVEAQEEKLRLASLLFNTLLAAVFLGFGVVFLAIFLTVLFWDGYRLVALGAGTVVLIVCGLLAARNAASDARSSLFTATLGELARDRDALQPRE
ncbi:phage holin family protein [Azoarcus sp. KH32C]|uniref:phage holin family protein n=1 Tax=Azoarcus sp. KH32C TaxID=748247 RepID=UPI0002386F43|nr:phage holin family protein [Azoarcus sp. KH32C]BAL26631.1 hypothetical protein AZKH_4354 [Azoarcus sp. KH32C]